MTDHAVLYAMLRTDFCLFVQRVFREVATGEEFLPNWHIEAMCHAMVEIGEKRRRRQIVEVPPRSLKSICASVALVAWLLGRDPTRKIICVSYSQDLAGQFSLMTRQVMKSDWYRAAFPNTVISAEKDTKKLFCTTAGGYRDSTSVGGTITGKGADLIIIDDPAKPDEMASEVQRAGVNGWFDRTLYSRLNNKQRDGILIVMQRLHHDDLAGHVRQHDQWDVLTLPAIAREDQRIQLGPDRWYDRRVGEVIDPRREPREILDAIKAALGSRTFDAQYQQEPLPDDGGVIEWRWFRTYAEPPPRDECKIVQSWDCASKDTEFSDFSVCMTFAVKGIDYYLLDVVRRRMQFPQLLAEARASGGCWRPDEVLIEDAAAGTQLIQQLRFDRPPGMHTPMHVTPKPAALEPVQGWEQWTSDITDMIVRCETVEALQRVQATYRGELRALSASDASADKLIGDAAAELRKKLASSAARPERRFNGKQSSALAGSGGVPPKAMCEPKVAVLFTTNEEVPVAAAAA